MKRTILYVVIILLVWLIPVQHADVADLRPVHTVQIYSRNDQVVLLTDTEDTGQGADALEALSNMKETASGVIYLDTAQYLLVSGDAADQVALLRKHLKPTVTLYRCDENVDINAAAQYLHIHGNGPKIKTWKPGQELPALQEINGKYFLSNIFENNT